MSRLQAEDHRQDKGVAAVSRFADWCLKRALSHIVTQGSLTVTIASGRVLTFGDGTGQPVHVRFTDTRAQWAFLVDADLRLGELYMDGRFLVEQGSLYDFVAMMLREAQNSTHPLIARVIDHIRAKLRIFRHRNLPGRSKTNVAHHYDLDGRLYQLFLDADRQYSCAYFENPDQSLEEAQLAKKRHLAAKLLIEPDNSILDIGCGWGGLALHLAEQAPGGYVLGVTLSEEQHEYASKRVPSTFDRSPAEIQFALTDYRSLTGHFDRIVSVGMFEHVGLASYRTFFRKCANCWRMTASWCLHTIGCSATPGFTTPWLDKYIFPGGARLPHFGDRAGNRGGGIVDHRCRGAAPALCLDARQLARALQWRAGRRWRNSMTSVSAACGNIILRQRKLRSATKTSSSSRSR